MKKLYLWIIIGLLVLVGCKDNVTKEIINAPWVGNQATGQEGGAGSGPSSGYVGFAPAPQALTIRADDGQELAATYYPAVGEAAPIVVLFHWVNGDQNDWLEIAPWLQNRGQGGNGDKKYPWLDSSWFPSQAENRSYAVLTVSFRGCDETGCKQFDPAGWLNDAVAAVKKASELEGIDKTRILTMGASIGADGAADACLWLNQNSAEAHCAGTLDFSPGNYLTMKYSFVVETLGKIKPATTVWCVYGKTDFDSANVCRQITDQNYTPVEYPGANHGMMFFIPDVSPSMFQVMLNFLDEVLK